MTNASETRDSELTEAIRMLADDADAFAHIPAIAALNRRAREAADTIDHLTSSGEAVAYRWMNAAGQLVYTSWKPTAAEALRRSVTPLYKHASPREGHVEVPVEWAAPLDHDELLGITEYLMMLADIDDPEADETDCEDLCGKRECKAVGCIVSKFRRVRAALPHNQGERKP